MLKGKEIVLGVTGSIACYKAVEVVSRLRKLGANVNVVMTDSAKQFVAPLTFQTISCNPVHTGVFDIKEYNIEHVSLAKKAELIVIAPATANVISKMASGIADDLLTATVLAARSKILVVPAMNEGMFRNPILQENIRKLRRHGFLFAGPSKGGLACGEEGEGRMIEPSEIVDEVVKLIGARQDLKGKKVIVTAGPTREFIDPVRFISNPSSGKMGFALAEEARDRGAEVVLISGPVGIKAPQGVRYIPVTSAEQMRNAVNNAFNVCNAVIMSAAVSDWESSGCAADKIKAREGPLELKLNRTPDIIAGLGRKKGKRVLVGFALETNGLIKNAKIKLKEKNLDLVVANRASNGYPFGSDTNRVVIIERSGKTTELPELPKSEIARKIIDKIVNIFTTKVRN